MGASGFLSGLFLCLAAWVVEPYNPWDFSRNALAWRNAPQNVPPARQQYGPAFSSATSWSVVDASQPRVLSNWNPVTVECGEAQVVVMVNRDLFGTGRLVRASDLILGSPGCQYKSLNEEGNVVIFEAGLHECGSTLQVTTDSLVYGISLYYSPNPGSSSVIIRTSPAEVPIECHYPRKDNVSSQAIRPTWVPFASTISAEERLTFSLRLMNEDWSTERTSNRYQLGDPVHIQADVNTVNHAALRLFIDNCVATLSPEGGSSPIYTIIDFHGCLVDGQLDDSNSAFVSPRLKEDSLQFTVDAFRFAGDARDMIYITCHLRVAAYDHPLDHLNKACSFDKPTNSWIPVEGSADVCRCCGTQNCELPAHPPGNISPWWQRSGGRFQRDASAMQGSSSKERAEADVLIGPLILDASKPSLYLPEDRTPGIMLEGSHKISMFTIMGLIVAASFIILALAILGFLLACKKIRHSVV